MSSNNAANIPIDPMMQVHDFIKLNHSLLLHICFEALQEFRSANNNRMPRAWDFLDSEQFLKIAEPYAEAVFIKSS